MKRSITGFILNVLVIVGLVALGTTPAALAHSGENEPASVALKTEGQLQAIVGATLAQMGRNVSASEREPFSTAITKTLTPDLKKGRTVQYSISLIQEAVAYAKAKALATKDAATLLQNVAAIIAGGTVEAGGVQEYLERAKDEDGSEARVVLDLAFEHVSAGHGKAVAEAFEESEELGSSSQVLEAKLKGIG